jgi:hypothetical protein
MSDSASKKTKAMLQAEVERTALVPEAAARVRAAEGRDNAAAERANAERIARSFEELQQRVAATETAQRAASAQPQPTPSTTSGAGPGMEPYSAQQVSDLIAQLRADQRMQYGPGAGMEPGLPALNFAGLTGQLRGRDAAQRSRRRRKAEAVQVESMFRDYVAFATTMKAGRSAEMRRLLLLMYITAVGYGCHKDRDPSYRDEVVEGSMHVMHTMVRELHAFENASPCTDLHVKLQHLNGAIAQAADSVYGDKALAWLHVPGSGYGSWR